jgi:hypothetical protein
MESAVSPSGHHSPGASGNATTSVPVMRLPEANASRLLDGTRSKATKPRLLTGSYVMGIVKPTRARARPRLCPTCGRLVCPNRYGVYRRHLAVEPDGRRDLCPESGREFGCVVRPAGLRGLDL